MTDVAGDAKNLDAKRPDTAKLIKLQKEGSITRIYTTKMTTPAND